MHWPTNQTSLTVIMSSLLGEPACVRAISGRCALFFFLRKEKKHSKKEYITVWERKFNFEKYAGQIC